MRLFLLIAPLVMITGCDGCGYASSVPVDAGTDAARPPDGTPLDVVGAWHECNSTVAFAADGTVGYTSHRDACTTTGTYSVDGDLVAITWADDACTHQTAWTSQGIRTASGLVLVDPVDGTTHRYSDDATPRQRWRLDGTEGPMPGSTTIRVVGTPGHGVGSACYWSTDHACGGLFSCGGAVSVWNVDATTWHVTTTCNGDCPCGAILDGMVEADGTVMATYRGASCERPIMGTFVATPIPD